MPCFHPGLYIISLSLKPSEVWRFCFIYFQMVKCLPTIRETQVPSLGQEEPPGEGNGNLLQYSCLENPMHGGAWWATVHGVTKSRTRLSDFTTTTTTTSQGYGFPSGHVWMWELDGEESWVPKNWCFWTVVLKKTPESPLDCKEIQPVHPKRDQSWVFIGRTDVEAETPMKLWSWNFGHLMRRTDSFEMTGKDWRWEEKGMTVDEMVGWHHWLSGHEFE